MFFLKKTSICEDQKAFPEFPDTLSVQPDTEIKVETEMAMVTGRRLEQPRLKDGLETQRIEFVSHESSVV